MVRFIIIQKPAVIAHRAARRGAARRWQRAVEPMVLAIAGRAASGVGGNIGTFRCGDRAATAAAPRAPEPFWSQAACSTPSLPCHIPPRDMRQHPVGGRSYDLDRVRTRLSAGGRWIRTSSPRREKASPFRGVGTVREATNGGISKWELMLDRWVRSVPRIRLITHAEPLTAPLPRGGALLTLCEALYADRAIPAASRNGGLRPACRDERSTAASTRRSA
jgi:hypothetical protein